MSDNYNYCRFFRIVPIILNDNNNKFTQLNKSNKLHFPNTLKQQLAYLLLNKYYLMYLKEGLNECSEIINLTKVWYDFYSYDKKSTDFIRNNIELLNNKKILYEKYKEHCIKILLDPMPSKEFNNLVISHDKLTQICF